MEQLRVPTVALEAQIRYFDERPLSGRIFLPAAAQRHEGPMHPEEWINQTNLFFPFLMDGEPRARLLNKRYVVVLTVDAGKHAEVFGQPIGNPRRVAVECGSLRLEGTMYIEMPEHASRLLDWANRPEPFLVLYDQEQRHIVQKNRITFLSEIMED
ncbi:MAG TPA: hypothetical protein VF618_26310 [Thermoanaerobaculia bacterium]